MQRRVKNLIIIGLLLVVGGLGLVLASYATLDVVTSGRVQEGLERATIEEYARIKLPKTATDLHSHAENSQDTLILVKFELPPADLPDFVRGAGYSANLKDGFNPLSPNAGIDWWQPQTAKLFAGGTANTAGFVKRILVDKTNSEQYVVYLEHFST